MNLNQLGNSCPFCNITDGSRFRQLGLKSKFPYALMRLTGDKVVQVCEYHAKHISSQDYPGSQPVTLIVTKPLPRFIRECDNKPLEDK